MALVFNVLLIAALAAVVFVLVSGVLNLMRGGEPNRSQQLMRWRVGLQLLAVVIIVAILVLRH
jgi:hypothetical protein